MKTIECVIIGIMMFCSASTTWAAPHAYVGTSPTPITGLELTYDVESQVLHVEARHVTSRPNKNFVRKVVVTKNSKETQEFVFAYQMTPIKFVEDINYTAEPGDHLYVELWGSLGGKTQGSLDILVSEMETSHAQKTIPIGK